MNQNDFHTGIEFARAVAKHFKLPDTTDVDVDMEMVTGANEVFGVKVKLTLTADDLAAIADLMPGRSSSLAVSARMDEFLGDAPAAVSACSESIPSVVKMTIARGDVLVLKVPGMVSRELATKIKERIRTDLGADIRILVVDGGTTLAVLEGLDVAGDGVTGD